MKRLLGVFIWLALLILITGLAVGCARGPTEVTPTPTPTPAPATPTPTPTPTPPLEKIAKIGEEASNGQVVVTVHSVEFYDQITGDLGGTYKPSEEGDVFAIVDLTVRNVSGGVLKVSPAYVRLLDNQDIRCPSPIMIIAGRPYELKKLSSEELPSGEGRRGMEVFTAKEGTVLSTVSYTTPKPVIEVSLEDLEVSVPPYRMPRVGEVARGGGIEMKVSSVGSIEKL